MGKLVHIMTPPGNTHSYPEAAYSKRQPRMPKNETAASFSSTRALRSSNPSIAILAVLAYLITLQPAIATKPKDSPTAPPPTDAANAPVESRFVGQDLKSYVEALARQFAMRERTSDPFGQQQDPNARPVAKPIDSRTIRRTTVEPSISLTDIVARIEITTNMLKDKRFLVGSRSIGQGDILPLNFRNKQIRTQITEISSRKIVFRNLDTGELGVRQLNILPLGMTQGTHSITAPGMVHSNPSGALEIDPPPPRSTATINPQQTSSLPP